MKKPMSNEQSAYMQSRLQKQPAPSRTYNRYKAMLSASLGRDEPQEVTYSAHLGCLTDSEGYPILL